MGCSKVNSAFHSSKVDQWIPGTPGDFMVKNTLSPQSGSLALTVEPYPWNGT